MKTKHTLALALGTLLSMSSWCQVVVIANRDAPVDKVAAEEVSQIFLRQTQTWSNGTAIQPIDIKEGSPLRTEFYAKITGRSAGQLRAYWARQAFTGMGLPPKQLASAEDVLKLVQSTPGAIGYVSKKEADAQVKTVLDPSK